VVNVQFLTNDKKQKGAWKNSPKENTTQTLIKALHVNKSGLETVTFSESLKDHSSVKGNVSTKQGLRR